VAVEQPEGKAAQDRGPAQETRPVLIPWRELSPRFKISIAMQAAGWLLIAGAVVTMSLSR